MNATLKRGISRACLVLVIGALSYVWFNRVQHQTQLDDALIEAVRRPDEAAVDALLANGASANARTDYFQVTALIYAANSGNQREVKSLLAAGADANAKSHDGTTALNCAQKHHFTDIESILRAVGAKE